MRILAIRGENIASLERFELDFRRQPLASAGIFAITGPTGSGKSSLLDAMCLALYHRAPRMEGVSGQEAKVGGPFGEIGQNDIRNLIRRGASTGFAETEFVGTDGESYKARWGFRAGKKVNSASQEEVSLVRLGDGRILETKKTGCQERIQELAGLSFEQFTRTVLLAQGRFAEFLRARENERADLLEKLTGTEIYSRISKAVYERKVREEEARRDLESKLQGVVLLEPARREHCEAELGRLESELPGLRERLGKARSFSDGAGAWIRNGLERTRILELLGAQTRERDRLSEKRETAVAALRDTATWFALREEEIRRAEVLDVQLAEACRLETDRSNAFVAASEAFSTLERERKVVADRLASLVARLAQIDSFLEANRRLDPVAAEWQQCRTLLEICAVSFGEKNKQAAELESASLEIARVSPTADGLESRIRELEEALEGAGAEMIVKDLDDLEVGIRELETFTDLVNLDVQEKTTLSRLEKERAILEDSSRSSEEIEKSLGLARELLDSTKEAASESAEGLRQNLAPGSPCPVCGSLDHPLGPSDSGRFRLLLVRQQGIVSQQESELGRHRNAAAQAKAALSQSEENLVRIRSEREGAGGRPDFSDDPPPQDEPALVEWLARRRTELLRKRKNLKDRQLMFGELGTVRKEESTVRLRLETSRLKESQARLSMEKAQQVLMERSLQLDAMFGSDAWRSKWEADPRAYVAGVERRVGDYRSQAEARGTSFSEIGLETVRLEGITANIATTSSDVLISGERLEAARAHRVRLEGERALLLEGAGVDASRERARARLESAEAFQEEQRRNLETCLREIGTRTGALEQIDRSLEEVRGFLAATGPALAEPDGIQWCGVDTDPPLLEAFSIRALETCRSRAEGSEAERIQLAADLALDDKNRQSAADVRGRIAKQSESVERWASLSASVGSADGKAFRVVAQRFTLEVLLEEANRELSRIAPRYTLEILEESMHFGVVDRDAFGDLRPVHTLSGGESFMVSLALALALSRMAGGNLRIESLFIDEGFGSLDPATLRSVMGALSTLHSQGRKVGVITHVEEMKEQIPVRIEVLPMAPGRSEVRVVG